MLLDAHDRPMTAFPNDAGVRVFSAGSPAASTTLRSLPSLFESLPTELRLEIYKLLFCGKMFPAIRTAGKTRWTARSTKKRFGNRNVISILQICRLFRSEAKWLFQQELVVAFTPRGLAIASIMLASTMLDTMELRQIALVNDHYDPAILTAVRLACPRLETVHFALCDPRSSFPAPLKTLIDRRDSNLEKVARNKTKLRAIFLSIIRYDWLSASNVTEFAKAVSHENYSGPRVLFSSLVIFEQQPGQDLSPDSNGGYLVLDPKLKTIEWEFRGLLMDGSYTLKSGMYGEQEWSFETFD